MREKGWNLWDAYHHVKTKRAIVGPHYHLKLQLLEYERHHHGKNSIDIEVWGKVAYALEYGITLEDLKVKTEKKKEEKPVPTDGTEP